MNNDLNIVKQYENSLKAFLLAEFGTYLPEDKVSLLNATNYSSDKIFEEDLTQDQIRGRLARTMLRDLINVECSKKLEVSENMEIDLPYGQSLEQALIEYYSQNLAKKYGFKIDEFPSIANDVEMVKLLNEKLDNTLDKRVFESDAIKLINAANFKELLEKEDTEAIKKYLERNKHLAADDMSKKEENELISEYFEREGSIQIVWIDGKKHVKHTDPEGNVDLTNIDGFEQTNDFIKEQIASVKPGEKLDPEKFYSEIKRLAGKVTLTETKDVDEEQLNHEEVDMLEFIKSNKQIQESAKKGEITHNKAMDTHVIGETKDIVFTEDHVDRVEAKVIKDGNAEMTEEVKQDESSLSSSILTPDEFKELTDKYARGDELTKEELEALRRTTIYYKEHDMELPALDKPAILSPYNNNNNSGYANNSIITYLVILTAFLSLAFLAIIFSLLK